MRTPKWWISDAGVATPVDMMFLLVFCLLAVFFLGFVGRLHATGVEVTNAAQAGARAASMAADPTTARSAAADSVARSDLATRCLRGPRTTVSWRAAAGGTWQGGSVTVTVSCTVRNQSLSGVWVPGSRTVTMRDTQSVDRYRR